MASAAAAGDRKAKTAAMFAEMKAKSFPEACGGRRPPALFNARTARAPPRCAAAHQLTHICCLALKPPAQVPDLSAAEVRAAVDADAGAGRVVLVDCRSPEEQAVSTIPSARTLPQQQLEAARAAGELEGKQLICFCTIGYRHDLAISAAPPAGAPRAQPSRRPPPAAAPSELLLNMLSRVRRRPTDPHRRSGLEAGRLRAAGLAAVNFSGSLLSWTHEGYPLVDAAGRPTKRLHVFNQKFALQGEGYEPVTFGAVGQARAAAGGILRAIGGALPWRRG
jgi:rhodanese-related sulfurtransferase